MKVFARRFGQTLLFGVACVHSVAVTTAAPFEGLPKPSTLRVPDTASIEDTDPPVAPAPMGGMPEPALGATRSAVKADAPAAESFGGGLIARLSDGVGGTFGGLFGGTAGTRAAAVSGDDSPGTRNAASPAILGLKQTDSAAERTDSAVATDEEVSLVSWLSSYGGGHGGNADACPDVCLTDKCCPTWEAQVDALFLWQGNVPSRTLFTDTATGVTALDANQLQTKAGIAPRYSIIYNRDDCRAIEVNYFQVWGFNAGRVIGPQVDAAGDGTFTATNLLSGPNYDKIAAAQATSSGHIQSLEVNLRRNDGGMIEWISGFRWLEWGQQLQISDAQVEGGAITGGDQINISTLNNLYGWQWGGDMMLWNAGRWLRINGIAKAGIYYNHQALQQTTYSDFVNPVVGASAYKDTVSFVGETGVNASFALTNWLSWRTGYNFFWLGGVAVPAGQLGLTDVTTGTTSVNRNGSVFLHGVNTGLEASW